MQPSSIPSAITELRWRSRWRHLRLTASVSIENAEAASVSYPEFYDTLRSISSMRYLCIHGHFYQPPRENPWLEAIELQDSAYPYHDWNERITAESYAPNAATRILDSEGRIIKIVNNYSLISFNFGPTLLGVGKDKAPGLHEHDRVADGESRETFSGHGSAHRSVLQPHDHAAGEQPATNIRRSIGASRTFGSGSAARRKACGCPKRRWIWSRWTSWRNWA